MVFQVVGIFFVPYKNLMARGKIIIIPLMVFFIIEKDRTPPPTIGEVGVGK